MTDTIDELEKLLGELPNLPDDADRPEDEKLPAVVGKLFRCISDRLADIEQAVGVTESQ